MIPPRYVVIVTGSREYEDDSLIASKLRVYPRGTIVLHGGARGADTIAHFAALAIGQTPVSHPYFSDLGRTGGNVRNALLVALGCIYRTAGYTVVVEAFPGPSSIGTWDCLRKAEAAGLTVNVDRTYA